MDITPVAPIETELTEKLEAEQIVIDLANLSLQICTSLALDKNAEATEDDKSSAKTKLDSLIETVYKQYTTRAPKLLKSRTDFDNAKSVRAIRKKELELPKVKIEHSPDFNIREVVLFLGKIHPENAHEMRTFLESLIQYGENLEFSDDDFKNALNACFTGTLKQQFLLQKSDTFANIAKWFDTVYAEKRDFRTAEKDVKEFKRKKGESIEVFFKRYQLTAKVVDDFLPENEKFYTTTMHKLNLMEQVLLDPAKTEYIKWKDRYRDSALPNSFEDHLSVAYNSERYHGCLPTKDIPVSHSSRSNYAKLLSHENFIVETRSKKQFQPLPVKKKPKKRQTRPASAKAFDPSKSSGDRPAFYNAHKQKPNPGPRITRSFDGPSHKPLVKQRFPNKQFHTRPQIQPHFYHKSRVSNMPRVHARRKLDRNTNNKQGKFCLKCGVRKGADRTKLKFSHSSRDCRNYPTFCKTLCPFCLQVKGIEAYHPINQCRLKKKQQAATDHYRKKR